MIRILTIAALLGVLAGDAAGQVRMISTGRVLDRNFRLGSGGVNAVRPRRASSNLYITGQVTGGLSFRGRVPYVAQNELRLALPSEGLDDFRRDSAGLDRITSGDFYGGQAFYNTSTTVGPRGASIGRRVTGGATGLPTPQLVLPVRPTVTARLYGDALAPFLVPSQPQTQANLWRVDLSVDVATASVVAAAAQLETRPQISDVFGVLGEAESERIAAELAEGLTAGGGREAGPAPEVVRPGTGGGTDVLPSGRREGGLEGGLIAPVEDEDAFFEILIALQQHRQPPRDLASAPMPSAGGQQDAERLDAAPPGPSMFAGKRYSTIVESIDKQIVLRGLAGQGKNLFARLMRQAQEAMVGGKFYTAANRYESAWLIRRSDPLPAVGAGLAYPAAGEAYRASESLRVAITRFPPLMQVRLDVARLMGSAVAERRFGEIKDRLASPAAQTELPLVLLMTFLHANRGEAEEAKVWAGKLKPLVADNEALKAYVEYILTGVRPLDVRRPAPSRP